MKQIYSGINLMVMITLDKIQDKTIIRALDKNFEKLDEYYIFNIEDKRFHRCKKNGLLGATGQSHFMNYETMYKNFEILKNQQEIEKCVSLEEWKSYSEDSLTYFDYLKDKINAILEKLKEMENKDGNNRKN